MALDPIPAFVGGGAQHSPETFRALAYAATGGGEGVVLPGDLKVTAFDVPGAGVQFAPGVAYIPSRAANAAGQSYVPRGYSPTTVPIDPTGSSGGKSRLIVVRVEDPWVAGEPWADPADPTVGPYVFPRVIDCQAGARRLQDVAGHALETGYALARIDQPASTATILPSMITDLRQLAKPRTQTRNYLGKTVDQNITLITNGWRDFPGTAITGIDVPPWATHATILAQTAMQYVSGNASANFQAFMGPAGTLNDDTLFSDQQIDTTTAGGQYRQPIVIPSDRTFRIPTAWRGTSVQISARVRGTASGGVIATRAADYWTASVTFDERAA